MEISLRSPRNRNAFQTFRPFSQSIRLQSRPVDIDSGNGTRAVDARVVGEFKSSKANVAELGREEREEAESKGSSLHL